MLKLLFLSSVHILRLCNLPSLSQLKDESLRLNIYQPQKVLLASVQLRLAHVSTLLAATTISPGLRKEHVNTVRRACEEAGKALSESASEDPCLAAELAFHYGKLVVDKERWLQCVYAADVFIVSVWTGWLQDSGLELESATPGTKASCTADSSLLDASRMVAGCAVDYRFVSLATRAGGIPMLCSLVPRPSFNPLRGLKEGGREGGREEKREGRRSTQ